MINTQISIEEIGKSIREMVDEAAKAALESVEAAIKQADEATESAHMVAEKASIRAEEIGKQAGEMADRAAKEANEVEAAIKQANEAAESVRMILQHASSRADEISDFTRQMVEEMAIVAKEAAEAAKVTFLEAVVKSMSNNADNRKVEQGKKTEVGEIVHQEVDVVEPTPKEQIQRKSSESGQDIKSEIPRENILVRVAPSVGCQLHDLLDFQERLKSLEDVKVLWSRGSIDEGITIGVSSQEPATFKRALSEFPMVETISQEGKVIIVFLKNNILTENPAETLTVPSKKL